MTTGFWPDFCGFEVCFLLFRELPKGTPTFFSREKKKRKNLVFGSIRSSIFWPRAPVTCTFSCSDWLVAHPKTVATGWRSYLRHHHHHHHHHHHYYYYYYYDYLFQFDDTPVKTALHEQFIFKCNQVYLVATQSKCHSCSLYRTSD